MWKKKNERTKQKYKLNKSIIRIYSGAITFFSFQEYETNVWYLKLI